MKITRHGMEIELTEEELKQAYIEYSLLGDEILHGPYTGKVVKILKHNPEWRSYALHEGFIDLLTEEIVNRKIDGMSLEWLLDTSEYGGFEDILTHVWNRFSGQLITSVHFC